MAETTLLLNGTLGHAFQAWRGDKKLTTAAGWSPWWLPAADDAPDWQHRRPVYTASAQDELKVQQVSTPWGTHIAGLWQQVPAAIGNEYELIVEGMGWSSEDPSPGSQLEAGDLNLQVGFDPTGGTDPKSPFIRWGDIAQPLSNWQTLRLTATAESEIITVYLKSAPNLPKRQQSIFWRNARLRPIGRPQRSMHIVGIGDTHIDIEPEHPEPGERVQVTISSTREHARVELLARKPNNSRTAVSSHGHTQENDRYQWRYSFIPSADGLYELRFISDAGARLLALRLLKVAREVQIVASDDARFSYRRVYVLLPPTADKKWALAAADGGHDGRFTIGYSADDAGIGNLKERHVLAVNPHHWPDVLTESWFQNHYPGVQFTAVVANTPDDLEAWLKTWL